MRDGLGETIGASGQDQRQADKESNEKNAQRVFQQSNASQFLFYSVDLNEQAPVGGAPLRHPSCFMSTGSYFHEQSLSEQ